MNLRKITSMTMIWSLIVLTFNSIVLYVVPEGRIANWAVWKFWGLTKHDWSAQHTTVGFLFLFAGILHIYLNWKPIMNYMKNKAKQFRLFTGASTVGFLLTAIFVIGTYYHVPPIITIVDFSEQIKEGAASTYGDPPYGQAQSSSLQGFTSRMGLDLTKSKALLAAAGIEVVNDKVMIQDIAAKSDKTPQEIYDIIKSAAYGSAGAAGADSTGSTEGAVHPADSIDGIKAPNSGMGKKTIQQLCDEIEQDCTMIIAELEKRGMAVSPDAKIKDVAVESGTGPMQIYETVVEIVNEQKGQ